MDSNLVPIAPHKDFENIKHTDENGIEYWEARELMPLLSYTRWENFEKVINKAKEACANSGQHTISHFRDVTKMVPLGSGAERETHEYRLSRYACYLIAQNGDPRKTEIALAQTYFALQTRRQELNQPLEGNKKRLYIRSEVKKHNKQLFSTARKAGVKNFGKFNNMGYLGLYGMNINDLKIKKGVGNDDLLDRAGSTELAANLFRITQTDEKLVKENIQNEGRASGIHYSVGHKVRKAIEEIGGTLPENLPTEVHIRKLEQELKKMQSLKPSAPQKLLKKPGTKKTIWISIPSYATNDELSKLKELLLANPGQTKVVLLFETTESTKKIELPVAIKYSVNLQKNINLVLKIK